MLHMFEKVLAKLFCVGFLSGEKDGLFDRAAAVAERVDHFKRGVCIKAEGFAQAEKVFRPHTFDG